MESATLELRLLGEPALIREGKACPLPASRKTRALLVYLATTRRPQRRDRLCSMLWDLPDDPRGALRWSLSKLRGLVDDPDRPRLVADGENVSLDLDGVAVDLDGLRACAQADVGAGTSEPEEHWFNPFCDGLELARCDEFQSWFAAERENVRLLQIALLRRLADRPEPVRRLAALRRLVAIDPLDEAARLRLVETLAGAGRRGEAEE